MSETRVSFVIPARNEEALIGEVLEAILASVAQASGVSRNDLWLPDTGFEVVVADDGSEDATAAIVGIVADNVGVRLVSCVGRTCGARATPGRRDATATSPAATRLTRTSVEDTTSAPSVFSTMEVRATSRAQSSSAAPAISVQPAAATARPAHPGAGSVSAAPCRRSTRATVCRPGE